MSRPGRRVMRYFTIALLSIAVLLGPTPFSPAAEASHGGGHFAGPWHGTIDWSGVWDRTLTGVREVSNSTAEFTLSGTDRPISASASLDLRGFNVTCPGSSVTIGSAMGLGTQLDFHVESTGVEGGFVFTTPSTDSFPAHTKIVDCGGGSNEFDEPYPGLPYNAVRITDTFENGVLEGSKPFGDGIGTFSWRLTRVAEADAVDDTVFVEESGVPYPVGALDNDIGQGLQIVDHTDPATGTVTCTASDCTYIGNEGGGDDSFTYTIEDSQGLRDTARVRVIREQCTVAQATYIASWPKGDVLQNQALVDWCWTGDTARVRSATIDQDEISSAIVFFPLRALGIVSDFHLIAEGEEPVILEDGAAGGVDVQIQADWDGCFSLPFVGKAKELLTVIFSLPRDALERVLAGWLASALARAGFSDAGDFAADFARAIEIAFTAAQDFVCAEHLGYEAAWASTIDFNLSPLGPDSSFVGATNETHFNLTVRTVVEDPG